MASCDRLFTARAAHDPLIIIQGVVILAYAYSFVRMRRPDARDLALTMPAAVG